MGQAEMKYYATSHSRELGAPKSAKYVRSEIDFSLPHDRWLSNVIGRDWISMKKRKIGISCKTALTYFAKKTMRNILTKTVYFFVPSALLFKSFTTTWEQQFWGDFQSTLTLAASPKI